MSPADDGLLWFSVSDLARQKGVSKQALAKRLERLEAQGLIETRAGPRGAKLVNLAAFDYAIGVSADAIRAMNGRATQPDGAARRDPVLAREQARRTAYQADIARLDLEARLSRLLPREDFEAAVDACAEAIYRRLDDLPEKAERLAEAVGNAGAAGGRICLKALARELRTAIAEDMQALAVGAAAATAAGANEEATP